MTIITMKMRSILFIILWIGAACAEVPKNHLLKSTAIKEILQQEMGFFKDEVLTAISTFSREFGRKFSLLEGKHNIMNNKMISIDTELSSLNGNLIDFFRNVISQVKESEISVTTKMSSTSNMIEEIFEHKCKSAMGCGQVKPPHNGSVTGAGRLYGDIIKFACDIGYQLYGDTEAFCLRTGNWSAEIPQCKRKECEEVQPPHNGSVVGESHFYEDTIRFECDIGYIIHGDTEAFCLHTGNWSVEVPQCKRYGNIIGRQHLIFSQEALSWQEAVTKCAEDGGRLAALTDPDAVLDYVKEIYGDVRFWVGGSDIEEEGHWIWINRLEVGHLQWSENNPNNDMWGTVDGQDCLQVNYKGGYDDFDCFRHQRYICEQDS